jgi:hypothetical protein
MSTLIVLWSHKIESYWIPFIRVRFPALAKKWYLRFSGMGLGKYPEIAAREEKYKSPPRKSPVANRINVSHTLR